MEAVHLHDKETGKAICIADLDAIETLFKGRGLLGMEVFATVDEDMTVEEAKRIVALDLVDNDHCFLAVRGYGDDYDMLTGVEAEEHEDVLEYPDGYTFQVWAGRP